MQYLEPYLPYFLLFLGLLVAAPFLLRISIQKSDNN